MISESVLAAADPVASRLARVNQHAGVPTPPGDEVLPPRVQATGTRRRLYEVALTEFGARGFHAVSVRDLTQALGLRASSLYAHVASKQDLLAELIRLGHEEHRDQLRLALLEAGSEPQDQIRALTRAHVHVHATYPLITRVCNRELGALRDDARAEVLAIRLDAERLFLDVIERGQRLAAFASGDPMFAVAAIGAMGIRVSEWWHPDLEVTADEIADAYAEFAVKLLA